MSDIICWSSKALSFSLPLFPLCVCWCCAVLVAPHRHVDGEGQQLAVRSRRRKGSPLLSKMSSLQVIKRGKKNMFRNVDLQRCRCSFFLLLLLGLAFREVRFEKPSMRCAALQGPQIYKDSSRHSARNSRALTFFHSFWFTLLFFLFLVFESLKLVSPRGKAALKASL